MAKIDKNSYRILYNFLLPFVLVIAFTLRVNFLSFVYFVFSLFLPLTVSPPTSKYPGHPHRFISVITFWAVFSLTCQLIFNFVPWENALDRPILPTDFTYVDHYDHHEDDTRDSRNETIADLLSKKEKFVPELECHPFSRWLSQMGLDKIRKHWTIPRTANLFAADGIVLLCGLLLLLRLKVLKHRKKQKALTEGTAQEKAAPIRRMSQITAYFKKYEAKNFDAIHNVVLAIACCVVGGYHPSFASMPYFAVFLTVATMWAFDREMPKRVWSKTRRSLLLYCAFHLCLVYIYQLPNVYKSFPQHEFLARILGLVHFTSFPCDRLTFPLPYQSFIWPEYLYPFILFLFYYLLGTQVSIFRENEDLEELESLFGKSKENIAGVIISGHRGSHVALAYEKKTSVPNLHAVQKAHPTDADEKKDPEKVEKKLSLDVGKKMSVASTASLGSSRKMPKMSFAEKIAMMRAEKQRVKNLAKWETFKPILETIKTQSYVIALIVMMAWSLCYHSWSTFVMLILSFVVWMHPNSQGLYVRLAPFIVIYATALLVCQFIYSLPLTQEELPDEHPPFLRQLGLEKPRDNAPVFDIFLKSIFNFVFWLALRQVLESQRQPTAGTKESLSKPVLITDKRKASSKSEAESSAPKKPPLIDRIKVQISNCWIFFVLALLLLISMKNPVVFYRVVYMAFFLMFLSTFTVSFPFFRKMLRVFWLSIIGYCLSVVTLIYTYQFHGIPELYQDYLGMSDDVAKSIGLERISSSRLLILLLTPISFLIFTLIQLNFFHEKMMSVTQKWEDDVYGLKLRFLMNKLQLFHRQINYLESGLVVEGVQEGKVDDEEIKGIAAKQRIKKVMGEIERKCRQVLSYRQNLFNIIWRLAEIQIDRVVAYLIVYIAVNEVSMLNLPLIACVAISLTIESKITQVFDFVSIFSSVIVILKMLYQMEFIKQQHLQVECIDSDVSNGTVIFESGQWFGMQKTDSIFYHTKWHIFIVLILVCRELIRIRQFLHRKQNRLEEPPRGIMFPGINRQDADLDVMHCFLYFCNYFFYKFGVEICFISSVITIGIRNDLYAVLYVGWLIFLLTKTRVERQLLWTKYTWFLAICFVLQYAIAVGIPGFLCVGYFWDSWDGNLIEWLFLPSFKIPPMAGKLFSDFFQLLCVSSQNYVFHLEAKHGPNYPGGSNELVEMKTSLQRRFLFSFDLQFMSVKTAKTLKSVQVPDFISDRKTILDSFKHVFFMYFYWITLSMIFIAGTTHVTLFAAGYVFGCFLFLWMGYTFFFKPTIIVLRMWDLLIFYNVSVILLKTVLQLLGCVYMSRMYKNLCWLLQLLGIACNKAGYSPIELVDPEILAECEIPLTEAGIFYDNLCFVFLLIQRRIFGSEYFKHIISELKAQRFFASRGAELIEKINKQEVEVAEAREQEMMDMVDTMVAKISKKHKRSTIPADNPTPMSPLPPDECSPAPPDDYEQQPVHRKMGMSPREDSVTIKDIITVEVAHDGQHSSPPSTTSPMSPQCSPGSQRGPWKPSLTSLDAPKRYRPSSIDVPRTAQQQNLDRLHRRQSEMPGFNRSQDEESDSWSINSSERNAKNQRKTTEEGGVKGLGPLQLINFAIKKGAIRDAVKESNEMEKKHAQMEKEMQKNYGSSDYRAIRKKILKQKARQKAKPDFDEDTFEADVLTNVAAADKNEVLIAPPGAKISLVGHVGIMPRQSSDTDDAGLDEEEPQSPLNFTGEQYELEDEIIIIPLTKRQRLKQVYQKIKSQVIEYAKMLFIFLGMLLQGTVESITAYLMGLSRDYRYIAYILQEEKRIHKELFDQSMSVDENLSKAEKRQQRAIIREKLQEKYDNSCFLHDDAIRQLHQYVEETEVKEESLAFDCPKIEIEQCTEDVDENSDSQKIDGDSLKDIEEVSEKAEKAEEEAGDDESREREYAIIQPAIIVQESEDGSDPKVIHVPQAVVSLEKHNVLEFAETLDEMKKEALADIKEDDEGGKAPVDPLDPVYVVPDLDMEKKKGKQENLFVRLVLALYYAVLSKSELICYIMIILNHINSASLLSMPLPFLMLCWGTLTVPLPTKTFWIFVISYTETMVVIKYVFQFGFFPWNNAAPSLDPFWVPRILGIEKRPTYAAWDLALLMTLFLHRNILMSIGLWKNSGSADDDEMSSRSSSIREDSKASNPPSLALELPKRKFSRRFTAISFSSVAQRLRKEKIKKKFDLLFDVLRKLVWTPDANDSNPNMFDFDAEASPVSEAATVDHKFNFEGVHDVTQVQKIRFQRKGDSGGKGLSWSEDVKPDASRANIVRIVVDDENENMLVSALETVLLWILVDKKMTRVKGFFGNVLNPVNRVPVDVYAPMFLCDIICFLIVIFGFSSFGTDNGAGSVAAYFEENKVPGTLVAMLIIQFVLIIVDRALFLRKFLLGKLFFQLFLVAFIHIWIFFLLPGATDRLFVNNFTCKLWYFVKSVYFLISAKQIRCGYPKFSVGNVLTRSYNYFNYLLKNAYMKVPFLFEIGLLTDWIWKDTSLNLGDWITLHDIYSNIARLKCVRNWEEDFPSPKGVKQRPIIKYGYGGMLLFLIILIIWFPLVLFSMANTVGLRSTPIECTCRLTIAGYQPLFDSTARMGDIQPLNEQEYDQLYYTYRLSKTALSYIADYENLDVVKASINGNSASTWSISPPSREYMILNLNSSLPMSLQFEWSFKRAPDENLQHGIAEDSHTIELPAGDEIRQDLIAMIKGESTDPILIPHLFPSRIKVPGAGKADYAGSLLVEHLKGSKSPISTTFNDVLLELMSLDGVEYWKLRMIDPLFDPLRKMEPVVYDRLIIYGFVDKVFPKSFSFITGGGILGLYMTIVFLLGQYIRGFVIDSMQSIMFEELPNVDRVLDLCHKIFFVRDAQREHRAVGMCADSTWRRPCTPTWCSSSGPPPP